MKVVVFVLRALFLVVAIAVMPHSAEAHAILLTSQPAIDGTVAAGTVGFRIKYNSRLDHHRSKLTLTPPQGVPATLAIDPASPVDEIDATANLTPGHYSLRWQVLAVDGHITRGDIPFTVTAK